MFASSTHQPVLEVRNVSVRYASSGEAAVHDINFSLHPQTITMLIGPNGSGKSTILKAILGIIDSTGEILFSDGKKHVSRNQVHIGYVPQRTSLDTTIPLTVNELLQLTVSSCSRNGHAHHDDEISEVLKKVQAEQLRWKKIGDLSGGQLQRVILARALLHHPRLLILDEPESGIDMQGELFFYQVLQQLVETEKLTALIASHEMEMIREYADQVLCINKTVLCSGTVSETMTEKNFKQLYGIHTKQYHHSHEHHH